MLWAKLPWEPPETTPRAVCYAREPSSGKHCESEHSRPRRVDIEPYQDLSLFVQGVCSGC